MNIGTVTEIKKHEYRVGMTPSCVKSYTAHGHKVFVQKGAGLGSSFTDGEYLAAGAELLDSAAMVYERSDMIIKVKEPLPEEYCFFREGLIFYTYLHLAADAGLTKAMMQSKVKAVAYETITDPQGFLPCLRPMSEIAGKLSIQEGAKYLERPSGGRGVLLGGVPGVERGKVAILGAGVAGLNACNVAIGIGAEVTLIDSNISRLTHADSIFGGRVTTLTSTVDNIERSLLAADLVVGAALIPGGSTPKLIKREYLAKMKPGAVIVDISIDQGGCGESSHITYHDDPVFIEDGIVHYCVGNMPGAVPRTSTAALTNTTLPYGLMIADLGLEAACRQDNGLKMGVNIYNGLCVNQPVAEAVGVPFTQLEL